MMPFIALEDLQYAQQKAKEHRGIQLLWTRFAKIGKTGEVLPVTAGAWAAVCHLETGLIWATNAAPDVHFPVCGGLAWSDSGEGAALNTYRHIAAINQASWCGQQDWRLPCKQSLDYLVQALHVFGEYLTAYYLALFPHDRMALLFWSDTPSGHDDERWTLYVDGGQWFSDRPNFGLGVRVVRGGHRVPTALHN